eukprot:3101468-Pyramimonas_sp.AAC.1
MVMLMTMLICAHRYNDDDDVDGNDGDDDDGDDDDDDGDADDDGTGVDGGNTGINGAKNRTPNARESNHITLFGVR